MCVAIFQNVILLIVVLLKVFAPENLLGRAHQLPDGVEEPERPPPVANVIKLFTAVITPLVVYFSMILTELCR
jgi:hypothetical protein